MAFDVKKRGEVLDDTPVAIPLKYTRMSRHNETIRQMIRAELSRVADDNGFESFEDADDFEVDDLDPSSPYEQEFEGLPIKELRAKLEAASAEAKKAQAALEAKTPPSDPPTGDTTK